MIRRIMIYAGIAVSAMAAAGIFSAWLVLDFLPRLTPDPMADLGQQTPARVWLDESGRTVHVRRTYDAQWRFAVKLSGISPETVRIMLAVEDRNFYRHKGVDFGAFFRAFSQNLRHGRIISGASTITMQLAGMTQTGPRRSLKRKLEQVIRARRLEQLHSKERILEEYLNRLPFGGKLYGFEAAAQYYFGQHAKALNRSESALLCGLPQRPNAYRPDRFLPLALERRDRVLGQLVHLGMITEADKNHIRKHEPLRFRQYSVPAEFQRHADTPDRMYFDLAAKEAGAGQYRIVCTYHPEAARLLRETLIRQCRTLPGVRDAAGVLLENSTGKILALTGTIAPDDPRNGQVNAATAVRSAGSTLKPFLYAEAISGGLLCADTVLRDLPVRYGNYSPGNYDGTFRGEVRAQEALADSLNTPAVRIAAQLGTPRILEMFEKMDLMAPNHRQTDGLSIALGTAGHSLLDLTAAYRVFAREGKWQRPTFLADPEKRPEIKISTRGTGEMIARMLTRPMPGTSGSLSFAWKTGTSNGNHDAWCLAFSKNFTLGVWFGNKDGRAAPALVGQSAAAPAAGRIMEGLARFADHGVLPDFPETFRFDRLCEFSGLRATADCKSFFQGYSLKEAPLRPCRSCGNSGNSRVEILKPLPETYLMPEEGSLTLMLQAAGKTAPYWFLNGKYLGRFRERTRQFSPGKYTLKAISETPEERSAAVTFRILPSQDKKTQE